MIVSVPVVSVSSSWVPCQGDRLRRLEHLAVKGDGLGPPAEFAWPTAQRRVPALPLSSVLVTVNVDSSRRSSSASNVGVIRRRFRASTVLAPASPLILRLVDNSWFCCSSCDRTTSGDEQLLSAPSRTARAVRFRSRPNPTAPQVDRPAPADTFDGQAVKRRRDRENRSAELWPRKSQGAMKISA